MERLPPATPEEEELSQSESLLKLVIDSAGKVRSAMKSWDMTNELMRG